MSVAELPKTASSQAADLPVGVPFPQAPARPGWYHAAKRASDVVLALAILIVTAPVVLAAMLAIVAKTIPAVLRGVGAH